MRGMHSGWHLWIALFTDMVLSNQLLIEMAGIFFDSIY